MYLACNLPPALLAEWLASFTCYCGNMGVEWIPKYESAQKVDPGEENSPDAPAENQTYSLSVMDLSLCYRAIAAHVIMTLWIELDLWAKQWETAACNGRKKTTTKMCTLDDNPAPGDTFLMLGICLAVCAVRLTMTTTSSTGSNLSWKTLSWFFPRRVNWSGSLAGESKYQPDKDHGDLLVLVKEVCV